MTNMIKQTDNVKKVTTSNLKKFLSTTTLAAMGMLALSSPAHADPAWGNLDQTAGSFSTTVTGGGNTTDIDVHTMNAVGTGDLDIDLGQTVNVNQQNKSSRFVAIDNENDPTNILGQLNSNGTIFVLDENGVIFGENAVLNVGGIVASTGELMNQTEFMDGGSVRLGNFTDAQVANHGTINVSEAGLAAFVSPFAANHGVINAKLGTVAMAAGEEVTLDFYGDGLYEVTVTGDAADALLENQGDITAEGGTVQMTAQAAKAAVDNIINMAGTVNVSSASVHGGKIILSGGSNGTVHVSGEMDAKGTSGGSIEATGQNVTVTDTAKLRVNADKNSDGDAGDIEIIATDTAIFEGRAYALSGDEAGNGGDFELSGANILFTGMADLRSRNDAGTHGTFLIDPAILTIGATDAMNVLSDTTLAQQLGLGHVALVATDTINVGTTGDVNLDTYDFDRLSWNGNTTNLSGETENNLSLTADTVNFDQDLYMGNGDLNVDAPNVNLSGELFGLNEGEHELLGGDRLNTNATTVGVNDGANLGQGIDVAADGATVNVGDGEFDGGLLLDKEITLLGTGFSNTTTINVAPFGTGFTITADNVTVDGFRFEATGPQTGVGVAVDGAENTVLNNNGYFNLDEGVTLVDTNNTTISNSTFEDPTDDAIDGDNADNLTVSGNTFNLIDRGDAALFVDNGSENMTVTQNSFNGGTYAIDLGGEGVANITENFIDGQETDGVKVRSTSNYTEVNLNKNSITNVEDEAVDNDHATLTVNASGNWWGVNPLGNGGTDDEVVLAMTEGSVDITPMLVSGVDTDAGTAGFQGDFDNLFVTSLGAQTGTTGRIQEGIDLVGDPTVYVSDGIFAENVFVYKDDLNLLGGYGGTTVIAPTGAGTYNAAIYAAALSGSLDGVLIDNFTIDGSNVGYGVFGDDVQDFTLTNMNIGGTSIAGIRVDVDHQPVTGGSVTLIEDNVIDGTNTGDGIQIAGDSAGQDANETLVGATVNINNNQIGSDTDTVGGRGIAFISEVGDVSGNFSVTGEQVFVNITSNDVFSDNDAVKFQHGLEGATVNVTGNNDGFVSTNGDGFEINGAIGNSTITLSGNIIDGAEDGVDIEGDLKDGAVINVTVNTSINGRSGDGVRVVDLVAGGATTVNVTDNTDITAGQDGVQFIRVLGGTIHGNNVHDTGRHGIIGITESTGLKVTGNTVTNAGADGVHIATSNDVIVGGPNAGDENTITNSGDDGVEVLSSGNVTVQRNVVDGTTVGTDHNGIEIVNSTSRNFVLGNTVLNAGWDGIKAVNGTSVEVSGNTIADSHLSGIALFNLHNSLVEGNDIDNAKNFWGMYLVNVDGSTVNANFIDTTGRDGMEIHASEGIQITNNKIGLSGGTDNIGSEGIDLNNSANSTISGNTVTETRSTGISINPSPGTTISGNEIYNVNGHGIYALNSDNSRISNNFVGTDAAFTDYGADNVGGQGIFVDGSGGTWVNDNDVTDIRNHGIVIRNSHGTNYTNDTDVWLNRVSDVGLIGIYAINSNFLTIGSHLTATPDSLATGNVITNARYGIRVVGGTNNMVRYNTVTDTKAGHRNDGIQVYNGTDHTVRDNLVERASWDGIFAQGSTGLNILNNTVNDSFRSAITLGPNNLNTLAQGNILNNNWGGFWVGGNTNTTIDGNFVNGTTGDVADNGGRGVYVTGNETGLKITNNVIHSTTDDAIEVNTSASAEISGNFIGFTDLGVTVAGTDNIGGEGVDVNDSAGTQVLDNTITETVSNGISLNPSPNSVVQGNVISNAGADGINVAASDGVLIGGPNAGDENTITNSFENGIDVDGSGNVTVQRNVVDGTTVALDHNGIQITNGTATNFVLGNTVRNAGWDGIKATDGTNIHVVGNIIEDSRLSGIALFNLHNSLVSGNDIDRSGTWGMYLSNVDHSTVNGNFVDTTGRDGMEIHNSDGIQITNNTIGLSGGTDNIRGEGIDLNNSPNSVISGNTVTETRSNGISINPSSGTQILNNTITNVGHRGILSVSSDNVTISGNTINTTGLEGIRFHNGNGATIQNNNTSNTRLGGIWGTHSSNLLIDNNTVFNAGVRTTWSGIVVNNSDTVTVTGNTVDTTTNDGIHMGFNPGNTGAANTNVTIDGNTVRNVRNRGIYSVGGTLSASGNTVHNTLFAQGIRLDNSAGVVVNENIVYNTGINGSNRDGIEINNSAGAQITNNAIGYTDLAGTASAGTDNIRGEGIDVNNSAGTQILDNTITQTVSNGISLNPSPNSLIEGNNISNFGAGANGIYVLGSDNVRIVDNRVDGNGTGDGQIGINVVGSDNVQIGDDDIETTTIVPTTVCIPFAGCFTVPIPVPTVENQGNDLNSLTTGIRVSGGTGNEARNNDLDVFTTGIHGTSTDNFDVFANDLDGGSFFARAGETGVLIENSTNVEVGNNGDRNEIRDIETGVKVTNSTNVEVDNNRIRNAEYGIYALGVSQLNIEDNTMDGRYFRGGKGVAGIYVEDSYNAKIGGFDDGNHVEDFRTGIRVVNSEDANVERNHVHEFSTNGIHVSGSNWADILSNTVHNGDGNGIYNQNSHYAEINSNVIYDIDDGHGILVNPSDHVDVKFNNIHDIDGDGIKVSGGVSAYIYDNHVGNVDSDGIDVDNNEGVEIHDNYIHDADDNGIEVSNSFDADIRRNDVYDSGDDGINVWNSEDVDVVNNYVEDSENDGIDVESSRRADVKRNNVYDSGDNGIEVQDSHRSNINGNDVAGSGDNGIYVNPSNNVDIRNNFTYDNDDNGIYVYGGRNVRVVGNESYDNGENGIYVYDNTGDVYVRENYTYDNGNNGIYVYNGPYIEITDNFSYDNGNNGIEVGTGDTGGSTGPTTVYVEGNEAYDNDYDGIYVYDVNQAYINDNFTFDNGDDGIDVNYGYHVEIEGNTVYDNGFGETEDGNGIEVAYIGGATTLIVAGNTVYDNADDGIEIDDSAHVEVLNNNVFGNGDDGLDVDGVYSDETLIIAGNTFAGNEDNGIVVRNSVTTEVVDNIINNNGSHGLFMKGARNDFVTLSGNTFTDNPIGAKFQSGEIDLTGGTNFFNGGEIGMLFSPAELFEYTRYKDGGFGDVPSGFADMSLVDNTIGTTTFAGQSEFYVQLENGAFFDPGTPTVLNALNATFDGINPSSQGGVLTQAQFDQIEAGLFHFLDDDTLGLFFFGVVENPTLENLEDFFNQFGIFEGPEGGLNVTITGLPGVSQADLLAAISPAAGEEGTAESLAALEPAAGGDDAEEANCWSDALATAGTGTTTTFSFGSGAEETLGSATGCQTGDL